MLAQMKKGIICIQRGESKFSHAEPITALSEGYEMEYMY